MLIACGFSEPQNLFDLMFNGVPLNGQFPVSHVLPAADKPALTSVNDLLAGCAEAKRKMLIPVRLSGAADEDRELWAETLKDSDSGFTTDPYSVEEFGKIQECSCEQSYSLLLDPVVLPFWVPFLPRS